MVYKITKEEKEMVDIDNLLREGIRRGASDIHLVNQMKPIFRINS